MDITHPFGTLVTGCPMMIEQKAFDRLISLSNKAISEKQLLSLKLQERQTSYSIHESIAIIPVHGALSKRQGMFDTLFGLISYEMLQEQINQALSDKDVLGIILDIDSPGGEVSGLFDLADFIYAAREIKPIWACANDNAFSAAYAIASSAERLFVTRTGGVGSIGVIATHIDQSSFDEKLGVKYTTLFAGSRKNDYNPHEEFSSEASVLLQKEVDRLYRLFVELVSRNRRISASQIQDTEAGLFFGATSIDRGLADQVMTLQEALSLMLLEFKPKQQRNIMTEKNMNTEANSGIQQDDEVANLEMLIKDAETKVREAVLSEIAELSKACEIAEMPEKLGFFIAKGLNPDQAKDELMKMMASKNNQQLEIHSQTLPTHVAEKEENLLIKTAKARAGI